MVVVRRELLAVAGILLIYSPTISTSLAEAQDEAGAGTVSAELRLVPEEQWGSQQFGTSVAMDGDRVVVGAALGRMIGTPPDRSRGPSGVAFVFRRDGGGWMQEAKLIAEDAPKSAYRFGHTVDISGDVIVAGGYLDFDFTTKTMGAAYVMRRKDSGWEIETKLEPPDLGQSSVFATSVATEGDIIVVGVSNLCRGACPGLPTGTAFVYRWDGSSWNEEAMLSAAPDHTVPRKFGESVAINGNSIVVGAPDGNSSAGSAYVFEWDDSGWVDTAILTASDGEAHDHLGGSVAIDGDWIVAGASQDRRARPGSAYVFYRGDRGWFEQAKLTASDAAEHDQFGCSVSVSGSQIVVGAFGHDEGGVSFGAAYVFERKGSDWLEKGRLATSERTPEARFGYAVAIEGETVVVGARQSQVGDMRFAGSAYVDDLTKPDAFTTGHEATAERSSEANTGMEELVQARALTTKGDAISALAHFHRAFELGGEDPHFFLLAAHAIENSCANRRAIPYARDRLKEDPEDRGAKVMLAALRKDLKSWEELSNGEATDAELVAYLSCGSRSAFLTHSDHSARRFYERLLAHYEEPGRTETDEMAQHNLPAVQFEYAELLAERFDSPEQALPYAERAAKACDDAPDAVDLVARILSRMGRHEKAIGLLVELVEGAPDRIEYQIHVAEAYARQDGSRELAEAALRSAYELARGQNNGLAAREIEQLAVKLDIGLEQPVE